MNAPLYGIACLIGFALTLSAPTLDQVSRAPIARVPAGAVRMPIHDFKLRYAELVHGLKDTPAGRAALLKLREQDDPFRLGDDTPSDLEIHRRGLEGFARYARSQAYDATELGTALRDVLAEQLKPPAQEVVEQEEVRRETEVAPVVVNIRPERKYLRWSHAEIYEFYGDGSTVLHKPLNGQKRHLFEIQGAVPRKPLHRFTLPPTMMNDPFVVNPQGELIYLDREARKLKLTDPGFLSGRLRARTRELMPLPKSIKKLRTHLASSPDGARVALTYIGGKQVHIVETDPTREPRSRQLEVDTANTAFSPDGKYLGVVDASLNLNLWEVASLQEKNGPDPAQAPIALGPAFGPPISGEYAQWRIRGGEVRVGLFNPYHNVPYVVDFDRQTGRELRRIPVASSRHGSGFLSADGRYHFFVHAAYDVISVQDLDTGKSARLKLSTRSPLTNLLPDLSPDGRYVTLNHYTTQSRNFWIYRFSIASLLRSAGMAKP